MIKDKFSAIWVSHSSISDYLKCPRAYYLNNVYRDPKSNHKIALMQPALALGQTVHEVIERIAVFPSAERLKQPLTQIYEDVWQKVTGTRGGFRTPEEESKYKDRGYRMVKRIQDHPEPILRKAIKLRQDLLYYWFSETDNIILCGKIDWLEYKPETDTISIIDFKTGKFDEDEDSLQLSIYYLLAKNCQKRAVSGVYFWYLDRDDEPLELVLPDEKTAVERVAVIGKRIALARKLERFVCTSKDGCVYCRPLERVVRGEATFVGHNDYNQDVYVLI